MSGKKRRRKREQKSPVFWFWVVFFVVLLAAGGLWLAKEPLLGVAAQWKAGRNWKEAQALAAKGAWDEVKPKVMYTYQKKPEHIDALRMLLEAAIQTDDDNKMRIAMVAFQHPESTPADKARSLKLLLDEGDYASARMLARALSEEQRQEPEIFLQMVRFLARTGSKDRAVGMARQFMARSPMVNPELRLALAEALLSGQVTQEQIREAYGIIKELMERDGEIALEAFRVLGRIPVQAVDASAFPGVADWLAGRPGATDADRLLLYSLRLAKPAREGKGAEIESIVSDAVLEFREKNPEALSQWLLRIGRPDVVMEIIEASGGRQQSLTLYEAGLQALMASEQTREAVDWLANPHPEGNKVELSALRAALLYQLGRIQEANNDFKSTMTAAEVRNHGPLYVDIANIWTRFNRQAWAADAFVQASTYDGTIMPPADSLSFLVDYLLRNDRAEDAFLVTSRLSQREPDSIITLNNLAYVTVLLGRELETPLKIGEFLSKNYPKVAAFQTTYALVLMDDGQVEKAVEVIEREDVDWGAGGNTGRAIRAAVYRAAGADEKAAALQGDVKEADLYPAERDYFKAKMES